MKDYRNRSPTQNSLTSSSLQLLKKKSTLQRHLIYPHALVKVELPALVCLAQYNMTSVHLESKQLNKKHDDMDLGSSSASLFHRVLN